MKIFEIPIIDESKIEEIKTLIETINNENKECINELKKINEISGKSYEIYDFYEYWAWTDLDTFAKIVLMPKPEKVNLKDAEIIQIIENISEFNEVELNYLIEFLELNTGIKNISDYIFYPENDNTKDIANKIIKERIKYGG